MSVFRYKLLDQSGKVISGVSSFSFDNVNAAYDYFEQTGRDVIYIKPVFWLLRLWYEFVFSISSRRIKSDEIAVFIRSLAVMLKAGVPLLNALEDAADHLDNKALSRIAEDLKISIESGSGLSLAMQKHPKLFPDSVIYMARMGEETGLLDSTLMDAADNMRSISRIAIDVKKALIYPVFALLATLGACIFWLQFTVPSLAELYKMMQVDLPPATLMVVALSESLESYFLVYIASIILGIIGVRILILRNDWLRYRYHTLLLKIPVIKQLISYSNMAFIFEYFSLLIRSGVDIYTALGVITGSLKNEVYRQTLNEIRSGIVHGNSISSEMLRSTVFPRFVGRMTKTGEQSGSLPDQFRFIADEYRHKLKDIIDHLKTLVEPVAILFIGGLMVVIIGALFFPIYMLIGSIGGNGL